MNRRTFAIRGAMAVAGITITVPEFGQTKKPVPRPRFAPFPKPNPRPRPEKARDPVCGIMVEKDPALSAVYKGTTYYFCSNADRDKFKKSPEKYVKGK